MSSEGQVSQEGEWPFRVVDFHGEDVSPELDVVPPFLNQEEIDELASHLEKSTITDESVVSALRKLPDSEYGRGELPDNFRPSCQSCGSEISERDAFDTAFGNYYHGSCLP